MRELCEETGLKGEIERLVGVYASLGPQGRPVVIVVYAARLKGGGSRLRQGDGGQADRQAGEATVKEAGGSEEVQEVCWFGQQDVPWEEFAFPSTVTALREFLTSAPP
jgi:ADP-ribose pyrophosphatase YjhB (NUDIX family)